MNLEGAEVRVTESSGAEIQSFTTLAGTNVFAASGGTPAWAVCIIQTINQEAIAASPELSALSGYYYQQNEFVVHRVVTYVRVYGKTLGGRYVESNEFEFPVDVCYRVPGWVSGGG